MDTETGELITVQEAADRLAVSRWMAYRLMGDQEIKSVHARRWRRIVRQSLVSTSLRFIGSAALGEGRVLLAIENRRLGSELKLSDGNFGRRRGSQPYE
jgi:excisionase family DNA binding protein